MGVTEGVTAQRGSRTELSQEPERVFLQTAVCLDGDSFDRIEVVAVCLDGISSPPT